MRADQLTKPIRFKSVDWKAIPSAPGAYVIYDRDEVLYVGMSGRNGKGNLRNRLRDHQSGQIVNMFAQYLFLARVQFLYEERITNPSDAKYACRKYVEDFCSFSFVVTEDGKEARKVEKELKSQLKPALNP